MGRNRRRKAKRKNFKKGRKKWKYHIHVLRDRRLWKSLNSTDTIETDNKLRPMEFASPAFIEAIWKTY